MKLPPDQASRITIREKLDSCVWVEAGAGSGKTTELVNRIINLVSVKEVDLRHIAAITFTRKAAAELKTRAQDGLEAAYQKESDPKKKAFLEKALGSMDMLFAETIHSFCMQLLRERPLEAGVPPAFDLMEGAEEARLRATVLHKGLDALRKKERATWEELRGVGIGPREMMDAFKRLCDNAEVEFPSGTLKSPDFEDFTKGLALLVKGLEPLVGGPSCVENKKNTPHYSIYLEIRSLLDMTEEMGRAGAVAVLDLFKSEIKVSKKKPRDRQGWLSVQARMDAEQMLRAFQEATATPLLKEWRSYLYGRVLGVLLPLRDAALQERLKLGCLTQGDLLRLAARMLRENVEAREHLAKRYRYLFVDEFQDTDPIQAEIVLLLTGDDPRVDWTKQKPRPGSLFVVGDPKQSIYRFRRADIAVFKQVKDILLGAGALEAPLTASFRSQPAVCEWINPVFSGILPPEDTEQQAGFAPLQPVRPCPPGYAGGVYALDIADQGKAARLPAAEAKVIARFIRHARDSKMDVADGRGDAVFLRPATWSDFMIIARTKKHLATYAGALDSLGVPNEVVATDRGGAWDGLGILIALLKAVTDPDDELSAVSCLRGPLFGVSDDELYSHKAAGGRFRTTVEAEGEGAAARALRVLRECWLIAREQAAGLALERILERTGLLAIVRSQDDGAAHAADLLAVTAFVREQGLNGLTLAGALEALEAEFEDNKGENIGRPPLTHGGDKVRIMNLHKAKGLEARFIFLVEPSVKSDFKPDMHIHRKGIAVEGSFPIRIKAGHGWRELAAPVDWETLQANEQIFQLAERDRLQYVAVTRAQDFLILTRYRGKISSNYQAFGPLADHLDKLPALKIPERVDAGALASGPSLKDREAAAARRLESVARLARPSFEVRSVTEMVKEHVFDKAAADWGKADGPAGTEWGTLVHKALETLVRAGTTPNADELLSLIKRLATAGSGLAEQAGKAVPLLQNALGSEVWKRMLASPERLCEIPFQASSGVAVVTGAIDLIYRVEGGWELVDYKTDSVGKDTSAWVTHYGPQLVEYAKWWAEVTGEKVVRKGLLFVRTGAIAWC